MGWFAEARSGEGEWQRLGGPYGTQERAKQDCRRFRAADGSGGDISFRTVLDDDRGTVWQEASPPHGWRLRWHEPA